MTPLPVPVAVFAYNLQDSITACLDSLYQAGCGTNLSIDVLVNGCSDNTARVVHDYARQHPEVRPIEIAQGDKANAWNHYVRECAVSAAAAPAHIFIDGDCTAMPGAIAALLASLDAHPQAHAVTGVPAQGRNRAAIIASLRLEHGIMGNLYALRGTFLQRLRNGGLYLPVGLIGDDSWIAALAKFDLQPGVGWDKERVAVCEEARCGYDSLSPWRLRDVRLYHRRRIRYALRGLQTAMLRQHIAAHGAQQWPVHVFDLYRQHDLVQARREISSGSLPEIYFNWRASRQILALRAGLPPVGTLEIKGT